MRKRSNVFAIAIMFVLALSAVYAQVTQDWVQTYYQSASSQEYAIAVDNNGYIYTAGTHNDGTTRYIMVMKYDDAGNVLELIP